MFLYYYVLYLSSLLGVMSQIQLIQPSSEIKKPGDSVKIPCKTSGFKFIDYYIHWVQQVPGKGLVWIGRIDPENGDTKYSSSFQGRFTLSTDNSITTAYLQITKLTVDDTATYFCTISPGTGVDIWGPGTTVTVTSAEYIVWDCSSEDDEDSLWSTAATFITLFLISIFYSATITLVKVKWFISRILQFDKHDDHFMTVLDSVTQGGH